jgi:hypothetical protein
MTATSNTQRGKATSAPQRAAILAKIEALEALNPQRAPVESGLVSGTWALLYQGGRARVRCPFPPFCRDQGNPEP